MNNDALIHACGCGNLAVVKYLVSVDLDIRVDNDYALYFARINGQTEVVEYLLMIIRKEKLGKLLE